MWRPLEQVDDYPLALTDARSFTKEDLVASDNIRSNFQGETFFGRYTPYYKWYYLSKQQPNELFIFKIHDSKEDVTAKRMELMLKSLFYKHSANPPNGQGYCTRPSSLGIRSKTQNHGEVLKCAPSSFHIHRLPLHQIYTRSSSCSMVQHGRKT